jgi:hypothetical protein
VTKPMIVKSWIGGLAVFAGGIVAALIGVFLMLAYGGSFAQVAGTNDYNFVPNIDGFFWVTVGLIVAGGLVALVGSVVQFIAWVGALVNSYALPEKGWFLILLLGGLLSIAFAPLGFAAMIAYAIAAPDGEPYRQLRTPASAPQPGPLAPTA